MAWRPYDNEDAEVAQAVDEFVGPACDRASELGMGSWLRTHIADYQGEVWLLYDGGMIWAWHTASRARCKIQGSTKETVHVAYAARHAACQRGGAQIVDHLLNLARDRSVDYVSIDPLDETVAEIWRRHGFIDSETAAHEDPTWELKRMYQPVETDKGQRRGPYRSAS